jgi:pimeloyl-ACP methyl ester carboxylesterase
MTEPKTQTLDLPGATLTYDVRETGSERTEPVLLMIGSPMDASGFTTLAGHFSDRTVVTYDPRGVGRSPRADCVTAATPDQHAEDLHQLISELDVGPVDIFASSGAVNALALVTRHSRTGPHARRPGVLPIREHRREGPLAGPGRGHP